MFHKKNSAMQLNERKVVTQKEILEDSDTLLVYRTHMLQIHLTVSCGRTAAHHAEEAGDIVLQGKNPYDVRKLRATRSLVSQVCLQNIVL